MRRSGGPAAQGRRASWSPPHGRSACTAVANIQANHLSAIPVEAPSGSARHGQFARNRRSHDPHGCAPTGLSAHEGLQQCGVEILKRTAPNAAPHRRSPDADAQRLPCAPLHQNSGATKIATPIGRSPALTLLRQRSPTVAVNPLRWPP